MTAILDQLSSRSGDRSEAANLTVVAQCRADPTLVANGAAGLADKDAAVVGDCAEVLTHLAEEHPDWVSPHAPALAALLAHKKTRVRWEAMHALAFVAGSVPDVIADLLPRLRCIIQEDASIIVRDYAVDALSNYASVNAQTAAEVYPLLQESLVAWEGRHAGHALPGLVHVAVHLPERRADIQVAIQPCLEHPRAAIRKAAKAALKAINNP